MDRHTRFELNRWDDLTHKSKLQVAAALTYDEAMEHGLAGEIKRDFPAEYDRMYSAQFGGLTAASTRKGYPEELAMWYDDLHSSDKLRTLIKRDINAYAAIIEEETGKMPELSAEARQKLNVGLKNEYLTHRRNSLAGVLASMSQQQIMHKGLGGKAKALKESGAVPTAAYTRQVTAALGKGVPEELGMWFEDVVRQDLLGPLLKKDITAFYVLMVDTFGGNAPRMWKGDLFKDIDPVLKAHYQNERNAWWSEELLNYTWDELSAMGMTDEVLKRTKEGYEEKYEKKFGVRPPTV